jgi:lipopolysaccharide heptosyltransferase II
MVRSNVKKILIIKLRGIGDVVLSTVVLKNLKKDFPDAAIDYLTEPPSLKFLKKIPLLNNILFYNKKTFFGGISIIFKIMLRRYDLVFDLYSNPHTALITFLSLAKYRAGFPYRGRSFSYNLKGPAERNIYHNAQLNLELLKKIGLTADEKDLFFGLDEADKEFAEKFFLSNFSTNKNIVGLSPSGGWQSKKCDPVKFAEIGDAIAEKYNSNILIVWGPNDYEDALKIKKSMKHNSILAPQTDIGEMAALIAKCTFIIANDSGPMHIATALNTPVLSLHGPTDPKLQGPFGQKHEWIRLDELECIGCNLLVCTKNHECFLELPIEKIMEKVSLLIKKNNLKIN